MLVYASTLRDALCYHILPRWGVDIIYRYPSALRWAVTLRPFRAMTLYALCVGSRAFINCYPSAVRWAVTLRPFRAMTLYARFILRPIRGNDFLKQSALGQCQKFKAIAP